MDKQDAVLTIIQESHRDKGSTASAKRIARACNVLGLTEAERIKVLGYLDFCDAKGEPWNTTIKKVW
jgi:hypothetical protein